MKKRGQFAVEHIMVVGIGLLVIIPVIYMFYSYSSSQADQAMIAQVQKIGHEIVDNAETIYYMGEPAKVTIKEAFPDKINSIKVLGDGTHYELVFKVGDTGSENSFVSDVPIQGPFYEEIGVRCDDQSVNGACYHAGKRSISLIALGDNVSIVIT